MPLDKGLFLLPVYVMPHTCCAPGCKTGYRSCKDETKYFIFRFPQDNELRKEMAFCNSS